MLAMVCYADDEEEGNMDETTSDYFPFLSCNGLSTIIFSSPDKVPFSLTRPRPKVGDKDPPVLSLICYQVLVWMPGASE